jgi:hypothetical protein
MGAFSGQLSAFSRQFSSFGFKLLDIESWMLEGRGILKKVTAGG